MVFLETNRTQIYRKYSPSQSSGERGVGLNTDGHGFARMFLETNRTQIYPWESEKSVFEIWQSGKSVFEISVVVISA
jgi:hypothetical protein